MDSWVICYSAICNQNTCPMKSEVTMDKLTSLSFILFIYKIGIISLRIAMKINAITHAKCPIPSP